MKTGSIDDIDEEDKLDPKKFMKGVLSNCGTMRFKDPCIDPLMKH